MGSTATKARIDDLLADYQESWILFKRVQGSPEAEARVGARINRIREQLIERIGSVDGIRIWVERA